MLLSYCYSIVEQFVKEAVSRGALTHSPHYVTVSAMRPLLALAAVLVLLAAARADDEGGAAEAVKERIAALDLDGAKKLLAELKADAKSADARKVAKDLEHELE